MTNVQEVNEPQVFKEPKGKPEWEMSMNIEHESIQLGSHSSNLGSHSSFTWEETHWPQMRVQAQGKWHT